MTSISDLHSRSLNNTDEALSQQNAAALDQLVTETRSLSNQIKAQIQELEKEAVPAGQDARIRKNQARRTRPKSANGLLKFVMADVPRPFKIHRGFAELSTGRATVSHAIPSAGRTTIQNRWVNHVCVTWAVLTSCLTSSVKPDATPDEVAAVVQSDQGAGGQVFAQAVRPTSPHAGYFLKNESCF